MKVGSQEFRDKVAATVSIIRIASQGGEGGVFIVHILQRGNEDVAETDDLVFLSILPGRKPERDHHPHFHGANASTISIHGMFVWIKRGY